MENRASKMHNTSDLEKLKLKKEELESALLKLQEEGYKEEELQEHIQKLHEYNEIKDIAQLLIGKIAEKRGVTTASLYKDYGLDLAD